ncbi:hypothetical protein [Anianabacter salinae]|uniref:hypothetical protein n=1 Tax=Anianabacter salinae TaxID=2851023 RepID=UPI00225DD012|nr:hypothetical protein [Anianabacter salinae]MBV0911864.1 hypothetical protein [Anianabacter salinae]
MTKSHVSPSENDAGEAKKPWSAPALQRVDIAQTTMGVRDPKGPVEDAVYFPS